LYQAKRAMTDCW